MTEKLLIEISKIPWERKESPQCNGLDILVRESLIYISVSWRPTTEITVLNSGSVFVITIKLRSHMNTMFFE